MPFIISSPNGGVLRGERSVTWTTAQTVRRERTVSWTSAPFIRGERSATWTTAHAVQGARAVAWTTQPLILRGERVVDWIPGRLAQASRDVTWTSASVAIPTVVRPGRRARSLNLNSSKGGVISAQYTHSGTRESLNLTVYGVASPTALLDLSVSDSEGGSLRVQLDGDLFQYERRQTPTGTVTTLRGENRAASRLGSARLGELIPWKRSPTPLPDRRVPCAARLPPQETDVSGVIVRAFQAAGMALSYPKGDPFSGLTYKEGVREYSTLGKTPDQVFADTLGQIGWIYFVRATGAVALPPTDGLWSSDLRADDLAGELSVRGEATNTPSLVTLTGADLLVLQPNLIALAEAAPGSTTGQRGVRPKQRSGLGAPETGGVRRWSRGGP